jgi:hypothetical protein
MVIGDASDYHVLDRFFREMVEHELFGYVIEGVKPLSAVSSAPCSASPYVAHMEVLIEEAIPVWKRLQPSQNNYVLKIAQEFDPRDGASYHEIQFINKKKLREVVNSNLALFQFQIGPMYDCNGICHLIADSPYSLTRVLKANNILTGILLGYGTHNGLMGGRWEDLASETAMSPPYQSHLFCDELMAQLGWQLLASCETEIWPNKSSPRVDVGFSSVEEEASAIASCEIPVPDQILSEYPRFVLRTYRTGDNKRLFRDVENAQAQIRKLLARPDFLECVLEKITGERPIVKCDKKQVHKLPIEADCNAPMALLLWQECQQFDSETWGSFTAGLAEDVVKTDPVRGAFGLGALDRWHEARSNLELAQRQMAACAGSDSIRQIVANGIYVETLQPGEGHAIESATDALVSYAIEDGNKQLLSASHRCWLDLSQMIPGFTHGMMGMRQGEVRRIYIHPAYGYGAITNLPPCTSLTATVTLHRFNDTVQKPPQAPVPIDLAWVQDDKLFERVRTKAHEKTRGFGNLWGTWLRHSDDLNFEQVCMKLKELAHIGKPQSLSEQEQRICNRVLWNLIAKTEG